jgi:hypothetical protein
LRERDKETQRHRDTEAGRQSEYRAAVLKPRVAARLPLTVERVEYVCVCVGSTQGACGRWAAAHSGEIGVCVCVCWQYSRRVWPLGCPACGAVGAPCAETAAFGSVVRHLCPHLFDAIVAERQVSPS